MRKIQIILAGIMLCLGLSVLGIYINKGLQSFSNRERVVSVKGLAEKLVKATGAQIIIKSEFTGNSPNEILAAMDKRVSDISAYLKETGHADFKAGDLNITDLKTDFEYDWNGAQRVKIPRDRYRFNKEITVAFNDVEQAASASKNIEIGLLQKAMPCDIRVDYTFPELNIIKPGLLSESIQNARAAGERFAEDSQSKLGKIKTASQGQISLAGRSYYDYNNDGGDAPKEPFMQKARVVSAIVFYLED